MWIRGQIKKKNVVANENKNVYILVFTTSLFYEDKNTTLKKYHFFVFIIYLNFNKKKYNEIIIKKIIIKSIYIRFSTQRIWPDEIIKTGAGITFSFYFL